MPWEDVPTWMWIFIGLICCFVSALIATESKRVGSVLKPISEKIRKFITSKKTWKYAGIVLGGAIVLSGIILLGYYAWNWISSWASKPKESPTDIKWYEQPITWVGVVVVGLFGLIFLLFYLQRRLPPGYAAGSKADAEDGAKDDSKKEGEKDKPKPDGKKGNKDGGFFGKFKGWFGKAAIYIVMICVLYAFITRGILHDLKPEIWKWLYEDHNKIFYYIPITILFSVVGFKFKHRVASGFALVMIALLTWSILDASGASDWIIDWWKREKPFSTVTTSTPTKTRYKLTWHKTPDVPGRNKEVREKSFDAVIVRNDDAVFEVVMFYSQNFENHQARWIWDKTKDPAKGTWSQPNPHEEGEWFLKETSPGHYFGACTDGSLNGEWIPLSLDTAKHGE